MNFGQEDSAKMILPKYVGQEILLVWLDFIFGQYKFQFGQAFAFGQGLLKVGQENLDFAFDQDLS